MTANDSAHVTVTVPLKPPKPVKRVLHPAITIQKNPNSQTVSRGGIATFEITVTNNGDVTLTKVTVTDPRAPGCKHRIGTLAPGKSVTYTCTKPKLKQGFRNVARAVGTAPNGKKVRDNDDAIVKVAPLKPAKIIKQKPKPKPKVISKEKPKVTG